jgi:hypothetical protein
VNRLARVAVGLAAVLAVSSALSISAQKGDFLSDEEEDALRDAQEPGRRIEVYLNLEQARLIKMDEMRDQPNGVAVLMSEYLWLCQEMKNWIEYQYEHHGDMREGLRALLQSGPLQLEQLRRMRERPEAADAPYAIDLQDSINSMTDALDGTTQALTDQQKLFGELKRQEKADARATKDRLKEEKKRNKQEEKLRKRMDRQAKSDSDDR